MLSISLAEPIIVALMVGRTSSHIRLNYPMEYLFPVSTVVIRAAARTEFMQHRVLKKIYGLLPLTGFITGYPENGCQLKGSKKCMPLDLVKKHP